MIKVGPMRTDMIEGSQIKNLVIPSTSSFPHSHQRGVNAKLVRAQFLLLCLVILEGAAHYAGLLLAPAEGFGRGLFLRKKRSFYVCFGPNFGNFWYQ